jgi:DNA-binding response OmpR family regulator
MTGKILIVEDEVQLARNMATWVSAIGLDADIETTLHGGRSRLVCADAAGNPYRSVVLDLMLPDGDGLDLVVEMRGREILTPVVLISALAPDLEGRPACFFGSVRFLQKPFALEHLGRMLCDAEQHRQTTEGTWPNNFSAGVA